GPNVAPPPAISSTSPASPASSPAPTMIDPELLFWQTIANNGTQADFEEYLRRYPQGRFAGLARTRLAALQAPPAISPTAPPIAAEPAPPPAVAAPPAPAKGEANWTI